MRHCPSCDKDLPISSFGKNRSRKDGLQTYCRTCHAARQKQWRTDNPTYLTDWRSSNPAYHAAHRKERPDIYWRLSYKDRMKAFGFPVVVVEDFTREDVIAAYGETCHHCSTGGFEELDHFPIPVRQAGPHSLKNVRPSCGPCNRRGGPPAALKMEQGVPSD